MSLYERVMAFLDRNNMPMRRYNARDFIDLPMLTHRHAIDRIEQV